MTTRFTGPDAVERLMEYAGEFQDSGHLLCFVVPTSSDVDLIYPFIVWTLDPSRVAVYTQGQMAMAVADGCWGPPWKFFGIATNTWDSTVLANFWSFEPEATT